MDEPVFSHEEELALSYIFSCKYFLDSHANTTQSHRTKRGHLTAAMTIHWEGGPGMSSHFRAGLPRGVKAGARSAARSGAGSSSSRCCLIRKG